MPRLLKFFGSLIVAVLILGVVVVVSVYVGSTTKLEKHHLVTSRTVPIPTDAAAIARGKHIAETRGCADCHGPDYGGAKVVDDGPMGKLYGPNLTKGKGGVVATFTDDDWVRAIQHGIAPDGRGLFFMPSAEYSTFSDDDLSSVIAFLKTVPPVDRPTVPLAPGPIARALLVAGKIKLSVEEIDHARLRPTKVVPGPTADYGRYLAVGCTGCHGKNFSGGKIEIGPPDWPPAANLTPHPEGRLGKWTESDFIKTLKTAKRPDGTELNPVMPRAFGLLNDTELKALWAYLHSLPPAPTGAR